MPFRRKHIENSTQICALKQARSVARHLYVYEKMTASAEGFVSQLSSPPVTSAVGKIYTAPPAARGALEPLFLPRSVAVIGATDRPGTVGRSVVANLLESKFLLKIYPVNPSHPEVAGIKTEKQIADIAGGVDLALVVTPAQTVPQIIG